MKEKVLIVYGGDSVEHDISIITALQVMKFLPNEFDFLPVYIDRSGKWWIGDNLESANIYKNFNKFAKKKRNVSILLGENILLQRKIKKFSPFCKIKSVLNCCHGRIGEDGSLSGIFSSSKIPCSSSGTMSSAICMDKTVMKDILKANEISSPKYVYFDKQTYDKDKTYKNIKRKVGFPVIVKPASLGSSIGISVCRTEEEFYDAVDLAFSFDKKILVERLVENLREFNCACVHFQNQTFVSGVNEVFSKNEMFTFDEKYKQNSQKSASVNGFLCKKVQNLTKKIYKLFDCSGVVRVDFLFDEKQNKLYVNEINSIPGSLAFYLFKGFSFKELLCVLVKQSILDLKERQTLVTNFDSDVLSLFERENFSAKK